MYLLILNISRTSCIFLMQLNKQCMNRHSHILLGMYEQTLSHEVTQLIARCYWVCVLCDCNIHNDPAKRFYPGVLEKHHITQVCQFPLWLKFNDLQLLDFPKVKIVEMPWIRLKNRMWGLRAILKEEMVDGLQGK